MHRNPHTGKTVPDASWDGNLELKTGNALPWAMGSPFLTTVSPRVHQQRQRLNLIGRIARKLKQLYRHTARRAKHWLARSVYSLPFLSRHDPRRKVIRCKDHCRIIHSFPQSAESIPEDWYLQLRPGQTIQRQSSICLDQSEAARFQASTTKYQNGDQCEIPEVFLACFHNARIEGGDFLLLTRENRILFESALSQQEVLEQNGILDTLIRPPARKLSGTYTLLAHSWAWGYYHWVIEVLPKLSLIEKFNDLKSVPLIVPHRLNAFQRDSLLMAGVSAERMVHLGEGDWRVDHLVFLDTVGVSGIPSPHAVAWLRKKFIGDTPAPSPASTSRIYVTRRDAPRRKIGNEDKIIAFLQEKGFSVVCLSDLSFPEQIELFRGVSVVLAPHGAGLTNMVFAAAGATVIEIFGDNYINGCYWALANICGHRHAFLTSPTETLDYTIPIDRLEALLHKVAGF